MYLAIVMGGAISMPHATTCKNRTFRSLAILFWGLSGRHPQIGKVDLAIQSEASTLRAVPCLYSQSHNSPPVSTEGPARGSFFTSREAEAIRVTSIEDESSLQSRPLRSSLHLLPSNTAVRSNMTASCYEVPIA